MTAPDNENDPVRRINRQRNLFHLQIDTPSAIQQDKMKAWRYLGRLGDPGEIRFGPWAAKMQRLLWLAVEIPHIRRKGLDALVESAWQSRAEHPEVFLRYVDFHGWIDLQ